MAQNLQDMIDKLRASQKVNQMTPEQKDLVQKFYERTQPIAGQGAISGLSSSQKRKLRWSNAKDAAKGTLSSLYGAAEFIPGTLARMGAAGVDQIAGTDYQSKIDDSLNYIPAKLRQSSNNTKAFDKGEEYTNDALMAAALLTAGASGPRGAGGPKAQLKDLAKNPTKYNPVEAGNIVRSAEAAGVDPVKVGGVKLTPRQIYSKYNQNFDRRLSDWELKNFTKYSETPAYQQKLWSEYNTAKNGKIMDTYSDIPSHEFKTYQSDSVVGVHGNNGATRMPTMKELNTLYRELSPEEIANMKQYIGNDIADSIGLERNGENVSYETAQRMLKEHNNTQAAKNTSRARAKAIKKRNMPAEERFNTSKVKPGTDILKGEDYPAFAQKRYNDWMQSINGRPARSEPEGLYYMGTKESAPDKWLKLTQENTRNNNILRQAGYSDEEIFAMRPSERAKVANEIAADEESFAVESLISDDVYPIRVKDVQKKLNTSRARANKLKSKNRSKAERTLLKKVERDAAKAEEDARNKTLEEMYNEWKRREDEIREAAEDAYRGKLRDEGRR